MLRLLADAGIPVLAGGGFAFCRYTGIRRPTKDFDLFVREADVQRVLDVAAAAGYYTELTFSHWLAKVLAGDALVDVIFSSGNGRSPVDDEWFIYAVPDQLLGVPVLLCPREEMIYVKAFIMERERFDGADVVHLLRAGALLDWQRLLRRFGPDWRLLLCHLVLFGFIYPSDRALVPAWLMQELVARLTAEIFAEPPSERICCGTLLSRAQYLVDVMEWGYLDARMLPDCRMSRSDILRWTEAIPESLRPEAQPPEIACQDAPADSTSAARAAR
jgi:hypothetical protein